MSSSVYIALEERRPEWRRDVLAMYDAGASDREVMRELDLTPGMWESLYTAVDTDFQEIIQLGRVYSHAWWEGLGRKNLQNKNFNSGLWTINMKNRFGWSEKTETSMTNIDFSNAADDDLEREVKNLVQLYQKGRGKTAV